MRESILAVLLALALGCAQPAPNDVPDSSPGGDVAPPEPIPQRPDPPAMPTGSADMQRDWAAIVALEDEARAMVNARGCASAAGCRTTPVGSRACGGPRYYLVYCAATTDSATLFAKLAQVEQAERAYNTKYQIASTCEFRMPPDLVYDAGECRAR